MTPDFNFTEHDIMSMGINAACRKAYERGRGDYTGSGFLAGMAAGYASAQQGIAAASTVLNVFRNGDVTVLAFADGSRTKVSYDPSYGYAYDDEKAIMAAMLKRVVGNSYIKALKAFARHEEPGWHDDGCPGSRTNVSRYMIRRTDDDESAADGPTTDPVAQALAEMSDDADFWSAYRDMPEEPAHEPQPGCYTDPVAQALADAPVTSGDDDDDGYDGDDGGACGACGDTAVDGASTDPVTEALSDRDMACAEAPED